MPFESGQTVSPTPSPEVKDTALAADSILLQTDVRYIEKFDPSAAASDNFPPSTDTQYNDESEPRVTLRSWLALLAADLAYFAQLINLLGAGVVSRDCPHAPISNAY